MYKKIFSLIIAFLLQAILIPSLSANVDQTNSFNFEYDCIDGVGTLKTEFDLWGHHSYKRQYHINKPWIIEIADENHTTVAESSNISISGCGYKPSFCNITSEWVWIVDKEETEKEIIIETDLSINKLWNTITISGSWTSESIEVKWFKSDYSSIGKDIILSFKDEQILLKELESDWSGDILETTMEEINFKNDIYNGEDEYYYIFSPDNKNIKLQRKIFKKVSTGTTKSSYNTYDIFEAFNGSNTWNDTCKPKTATTNNGYCTTLDYWDYNQHHYTTTKVKLHPITLTCTEVKYSNGKKQILADSFKGTLSGIKEAQFWWKVKINGQVPDDFWSIVIYANDTINISGLKYEIVWEIDGKKLGVDSIEITLKENDFTLWKYTEILDPMKDTQWLFSDLNGIKINNESWESITKRKGNYQIVFSFFSGEQLLGTNGLPLLIIPNNDISINGPLEMNSGELYANGEDSKNICVPLSDSYGNNFTDYGEITKESINITKWIYLDQIDNTWEAVEINENPTFNDSEICFKLTSKAPWENIKLTLKAPKHEQTQSQELDGNFKHITNITLNISFKKPFIWELSASWWLAPEIGTMMQYKLDVIPKQTKISINPSLKDYKSSIKVVSTKNHKIEWVSITNLLSNPSLFEARINTSTGATSFDTSPNIILNPSPVIYYRLWWKDVKYYLSASDDDFDNDNIDYIQTNETNEFIGLTIEGTSQWNWKYEITGQKENFSDISKSTMRQAIRKNAYELITSLTSGETVNGIKYIEWKNETISGTLSYETLIVKNGNVIISWDLNTSGKKLGIIVLKDNYDVNNDYNNSGNIYITPDVKKINALIYADGGIISADSHGIVYETDSASRTNALQKQLILVGSVFTRNTIGWAILAGGNYFLPWGQETSSFDKAMIYDLNYLRRGNNGCKDDDADWVCDEYGDAFIIKYNPNIALDPPRWF